MKALKLSLLLTILAFSVACQKKSNESTADNLLGIILPVKAEILIADVSNEQCLNLEKLITHLEDPNFSFPASVMTTNLKSLNQMPLSKNQYFAHASFYHKTAKANELGLFSKVKQDECKSVQLTTASGETQTFQITESSNRHIALKLTDAYAETLRPFHKKALVEKLQPYEYIVTYVSASQLDVIEKYRTHDALCSRKNQKPLNFQVTKQINWATSAEGLPRQYAVNPTFLEYTRKALSPVNPPLELPVQPELPFEDPIVGPGTDTNTSENTVISIEEITQIMSTPIRNEVKLCS